MIYCYECSLWLDHDDGEHTVINAASAASLSPKGSPTSRGYKLTGFLAAGAVLLLIIYGTAAYFLVAPPEPALNTTLVRLTAGHAQGGPVAHARGMLVPTRLPTAKAAVLEKPAVLEKSASIAKAVEFHMVPAPVAIARKPEQVFRPRIEIVEGVERCYAIPGGREIQCNKAR